MRGAVIRTSRRRRVGYLKIQKKASTKKNVVVWVAVLPVLGLSGGPPRSQMGDIMCLDTDKVG